MARIGMYDHLNESDPIHFAPTIGEIVRAVRERNYGVHRFMSELVRQEKSSEEYKKYGNDLVDAIAKSLEAGGF